MRLININIYYGKGYSFKKSDLLCSAVILLVGAIIILTLRWTMYAYLIGTLIGTIGNFWLLARKKAKRNEVKTA